MTLTLNLGVFYTAFQHPHCVSNVQAGMGVWPTNPSGSATSLEHLKSIARKYHSGAVRLRGNWYTSHAISEKDIDNS